MGRFPAQSILCSFVACGALQLFAAAGPAATLRRVGVLGTGKSVEVEITASRPIAPSAQEVKSPERLVLDFPNTVPDAALRDVTVNRGDVKTIRVGLFTSDPPVTRVVIDLETAQKYQMFPSGKSVIVKFSRLESARPAIPQLQPATLAQQSAGLAHVQSASGLPAIATISYAPAAKRAAPRVQAPKPRSNVEVEYANDRLRIWANKASLAQVLNEVRRQTGADIPLPAGAQQDQIVADIPPSPPRDALAALLNGSRFNFIIVGADRDPNKLKTVMLTAKGEGVSQPIIYTGNNPADSNAEPQPEPAQAEAPQAEPPPVDQAVTNQPANQPQPNDQGPQEVQPDMIPNIPPDGSPEPPQ
jgi:hypothetical protein